MQGEGPWWLLDDWRKEARPVERNPPNHDQLFKELLANFLPEFLLLVAPRQAHRLKLEHGEFLEGETFTDFPAGDRHQADLVYATKTLDGTPECVLIHIEVESRFRSTLDQRMARYGLSLMLRHGCSVLPVALFLRGGGRQHAREIYPRIVEFGAAGFWFNRYRYLAFAPSTAAAEKYLARKDPLAAALAALMRYASGSPAEHKMACLRRIVAARELNPARSFQLANIVDTYINLNTEEEEKFSNEDRKSDANKDRKSDANKDRRLASFSACDACCCSCWKHASAACRPRPSSASKSATTPNNSNGGAPPY
jgi:hypothetical protein